MSRYEQGLMVALLDSIVPGNAMIMLSDKSAATDLVSDHYQVPYSRQTPGQSQLASWQDADDAPALHLPAANEFIAEDVSLVRVDSDNPDAPAIALQSERQTVWFLQDDEFRVPKGATYINFRTRGGAERRPDGRCCVIYRVAQGRG